METETCEETPNNKQNQDQIPTQDRKLPRPKTRETTDQMMKTMNNQDVHDEILLRRMAGALSRPSHLAVRTSHLTDQSGKVIRAELLVHPQYIQQLPSIQNLLSYLERKGRSENTRIAYEKNLKALALQPTRTQDND